MGSLADHPGLEFAVVDCETTGFSPARGDRIVEVAVVRVGAGAPPREMVALVNPERDVGPTHIHGITNERAQRAPTFATIAWELDAMLQGAVIVAHNAQFDRAFLADELERAGVGWGSRPTMCTIKLSHRVEPGKLSRKLDECCVRHAVPRGRKHSALDDARATATLLGKYLSLAPARGLTTLKALGCDPARLPSKPGEAPAASARVVRNDRGRSVEAAAPPPPRTSSGFIASLVAKIPNASDDEGTSAYLDLLDRVLLDRVLTIDEAAALREVATQWGLSEVRIDQAHVAYLDSLVRVAVLDHVVTRDERRELLEVQKMLGFHEGLLSDLIDRAMREAGAPRVHPLAGRSVCILGDLTMASGLLERARAESLAEAAGAKVRKGLTKTVDVVVVPRAFGGSERVRRAEELGIERVDEATFLGWVGAGG